MLLIVWSFFCSSCGRSVHKNDVDKMNKLAYSYKYRDLQKTQQLAKKAYSEAEDLGYKQGITEALCIQAYCSLARMHYAEADSILKKAESIAPDNISRLYVEVMYMRLCQRRSQNKGFYLHQFSAERLINRIHNNLQSLSDYQSEKYTFLRSEYGIILSAYHYYVGHEQLSTEVLLAVNEDDDIKLHSDTAQWLNYIYNLGSGGLYTQKSHEEELMDDFYNLMQCFVMARGHGMIYFEANALQAISQHITDSTDLQIIKKRNSASLRFLNDADVPDSEMPVYLAQRALELFVRYGNVYQIAASWRTLAEAYMAKGDYESMLYSLQMALSDTLIYQSPKMMSSINEKLSMAYSALNDKRMSDVCRNHYLDMLDSTRQDRQLEARAVEMHESVEHLQLLVAMAIITLVVLLVVLYVLLRRRKSPKYLSHTAKLQERLEELEEEKAMCLLNVNDQKRINLEQHARLSFVQNILPMIDRMVYASTHKVESEDRQYIMELCQNIQSSNELLTKWVQLRKGDVKLKIETFRLQELFDILKLGNVSFAKQGINLDVADTDIMLKADKALTLFLLNTLVDNSRKYSIENGTVSVKAQKCDDGYADISVSDNGCGMTQEQASKLFEYKPIDNTSEDLKEQKSHGFGLINCRGIMNSYRKLSSIFSAADIKVESEKGKGTTFVFRLPYVVKCLIILLSLNIFNVNTASANYKDSPNYQKASAYCDSVYESNVNYDYERTLIMADSCIKYVNRCYREQFPNATDTIAMMGGKTEIRWYESGVPMDYFLILSLRNEIAVAALALHEWGLYSSNNSTYTALYLDTSSDSTLSSYCKRMSLYETANNVLLFFFFAVILLILLIIYKYYFREIVIRKKDIISNIEKLTEEIGIATSERDRLHVTNSIIDNSLSTIKHETMYYPARISAIINDGEKEEITELVTFYRSLYGILSSQCQKLLSEKAYKAHTFNMNDLLEKALKYADVADTLPTKDIRLSGNLEMLLYIMLLLKRKNGGEKPVVSIPEQEESRYVQLSVTCPNLRMEEEDASKLFTTSTHDVDYLIMKQIMREIGEMTNKYGSGIHVSANNQETIFAITIPRSTT